jgi:hypothetical protein
VRTGKADKYGSPQFLGASREESSANAAIFFDCAASLLAALDPAVVGAGDGDSSLSDDVRIFVTSDDPEVLRRAKEDPRFGDKVGGWPGERVGVQVGRWVGGWWCWCW